MTDRQARIVPERDIHGYWTDHLLSNVHDVHYVHGRRDSQGTGIAISAITLWELARLATHDRLEITGTVEAFVEKMIDTEMSDGRYS